MDFSLFYFANNDTEEHDRYRLLLDGARFADDNGFTAVWTPERHFHPFGGLYPNPSVTGAAVAAVTQRVAVRAGSVVAPLHHPMRIAEEWSVVDNLSGGRAGVALASGWHAADFALRPENYETRKSGLMETVETIRRLWRRESVSLTDGAGETVELTMFPPPVQPELPMWLTSGGTPATFTLAGEHGMGMLTHLLGQEVEVLAQRIEEYRRAHREHQPASAGQGHVAVMVHTFVGTDRDTVRETVREPFSRYLASSFDLLIKAAEAAGAQGADMSRELKSMGPEDRQFLVAQAFDRYFETSGMFGTVDDCMAMLKQLKDAGVDEVACLVDFGVPTDAVVGGFEHLARLHDTWRAHLGS
ncbi:MupA/Atu3671 family FMN-dependent luciferase-like monooxygenase [Streptomyces rapamycinicus]|uniref:Monooxygenase n=2 Tax=Streptomyces rapamycinicus TaxID=1226757 RepID=A0A0A0NII9_STRRN|nr:MupA/Atu3671 family FMN-dependent luciferase-like monooxygenase [Streptomyces rapamycinicus]AGP57006.1 peptide synthetase [Streptomyces rapamycinicus NRRL 5491]MBB4784634.1 natural product biosynthesis luciferase-like monooxygenase protein [Streptomyces rapamycinicus]RLV79884.1 monooxygenase [Streptomyces rapamycinicus NRRL 5491]UTO64921.1 LLM class flavin-dependent oxidoreductase [Streptomyces rapamycinicus]UTP32876.1 LLM class flavin-dependent oxidoreductase [Streptomyces rapamycinicus NR